MNSFSLVTKLFFSIPFAYILCSKKCYSKILIKLETVRCIEKLTLARVEAESQHRLGGGGSESRQGRASGAATPFLTVRRSGRGEAEAALSRRKERRCGRASMLPR